MRSFVRVVVALLALAALGVGTATYTVRPGDTLSGIAHRLGVSADELARLNGITDPNHIEVGQVLQTPDHDLGPYEQLGGWVDVYDFAPAFHASDVVPQLKPESVDGMAAAGIRTLYLQASVNSNKATGLLESPDLLGAFLDRAHARGMRVVAWYLPTFVNVGADLQRLRAMRDFRFRKQAFDGLAVDIEATTGVPDTALRNQQLLTLSRILRAETSTALGAIVLPPVLLEKINTSYWPSFPWQQLKPYYDVWLPMSYWTDRTSKSGYRDAYRYTAENLSRVRTNLGDPKAAVHMIGGIGGSSKADQYRGFVTAARERGAIGISLYDYRITGTAVWPILNGR